MIFKKLGCGMDFKAKRFSCIHVKDFSKREKPTNNQAGSWAFIRQQQSILNYLRFDL